MPNCPIPGAHRRLEDCHRLWHRAAESYDEPEEYRVNLNALLEALRSVTFVLQNEHGQVPDFETWYPTWQELMSQDGVLVWLRDARNEVVHQGDLETFSTATAGLQASWDEPEVITFEVPPLWPTPAIAASLAERELPDDVRKGGLLRVERRWVARTLPDWELLDALAHGYGILALLIKGAHRQAGAQMHTLDTTGDEAHVLSTESRGGRPPCMIASRDLRTVSLNLSTGEFLESSFVPVQRGDLSEQDAFERFGFDPTAPVPNTDDALEWADFLMERARHVMNHDKYHLQFAFLFVPDGSNLVISGMPEDQQQKYLFMRDVASTVERFGATGIVLIADSWYLEGVDDLPRGKRPGEVASRKEALTVTAARSDGATRLLIAPYRRDTSDEIHFEETRAANDVGQFFLSPVLNVWHLPVPSEEDAVRALYKGKDDASGAGDAGVSDS